MVWMSVLAVLGDSRCAGTRFVAPMFEDLKVLASAVSAASEPAALAAAESARRAQCVARLSPSPKAICL